MGAALRLVASGPRRPHRRSPSCAFFRSIAEERARAAEAEAKRLRNLLEEVKEVAWTNRDIAPELSTIIIDTIRTREDGDRRRELP